jgi:hypothetical protein
MPATLHWHGRKRLQGTAVGRTHLTLQALQSRS